MKKIHWLIGTVSILVFFLFTSPNTYASSHPWLLIEAEDNTILYDSLRTPNQPIYKSTNNPSHYRVRISYFHPEGRKVMISDSPDFTGKNWEFYHPQMGSNVKNWQFSPNEGKKQIWVKFGLENGEEEVISGYYYLDTTPPKGEVYYSPSAVGRDIVYINFTLSAQDNLTPEKVIDFSISERKDFADAVWQSFQKNLKWPTPLSWENKEELTFYLKFRDLAGNVSPIYTIQIPVDKAPPELFVEIDPKYSDSLERKLVIYAYDELLPITKVYVSNDPLLLEGVKTFSWEQLVKETGAPPVIDWKFDNRRVVWVKVEDLAGNTTEPQPYYAAKEEDRTTPSTYNKVEIPVKEDLTVWESTPEKGYPFGLGAHPYLSPQSGEQIILLLFPLVKEDGQPYLPKNAYITHAGLDFFVVAGYSKEPDGKVPIQIFTLNKPFSQKNTSWNNMPELEEAFFTIKIPVKVGVQGFMGVKAGVEYFLQQDKDYIAWAIRVPPFAKGYVQFADKDSLYKNRTPVRLQIFYSTSPVKKEFPKSPPPPPRSLTAYFDRLSKKVIISWDFEKHVSKIQIFRPWASQNKYSVVFYPANTYSDEAAYEYFKENPSGKIKYAVRSCYDTSQDINCVYASRQVETQPIECGESCPTQTLKQPKKELTPTISPLDKEFSEKVKDLEKELQRQEKKALSFKKKPEAQPSLLRKILSLLEKFLSLLRNLF